MTGFSFQNHHGIPGPKPASRPPMLSVGMTYLPQGEILQGATATFTNNPRLLVIEGTVDVDWSSGSNKVVIGPRMSVPHQLPPNETIVKNFRPLELKQYFYCYCQGDPATPLNFELTTRGSSDTRNPRAIQVQIVLRTLPEGRNMEFGELLPKLTLAGESFTTGRPTDDSRERNGLLLRHIPAY